ncbi:MAG TPA: rRNA maturation RNase YbeY [Candidatus Acidoferrales bacterium]|nr:rRNA maturation RNase YbeY [Candidatus Acidoferrales bacterium]
MIVNRQRRVPVAVKPLKDFLGRLQQALDLSDGDVTVCLVSDVAIARMNWDFRGKRGPTDVLSFPGREKERKRAGQKGTSHGRRTEQGAREDSYLGDIAVSPETAERNARGSRRALPQELRILILHGMLHLAGYDHERDHGEMARLESCLRRRFGLS